MKSRKQKSLYLGGGFRDHQILFMLPILDGICKKKLTAWSKNLLNAKTTVKKSEDFFTHLVRTGKALFQGIYNTMENIILF